MSNLLQLLTQVSHLVWVVFMHAGFVGGLNLFFGRRRVDAKDLIGIERTFGRFRLCTT
jgi:hypothetical protein